MIASVVSANVNCSVRKDGCFYPYDDCIRKSGCFDRFTIHAGSVYLSLGDREEKTRNSVMATVGGKIREAHGLLQEQGVSTILEWNQGNHFKDADIRTAKAFAWVIRTGKGDRK